VPKLKKQRDIDFEHSWPASQPGDTKDWLFANPLTIKTTATEAHSLENERLKLAILKAEFGDMYKRGVARRFLCLPKIWPIQQQSNS
jgi:hypothetical protein